MVWRVSEAVFNFLLYYYIRHGQCYFYVSKKQHLNHASQNTPLYFISGLSSTELYLRLHNTNIHIVDGNIHNEPKTPICYDICNAMCICHIIIM